MAEAEAGCSLTVLAAIPRLSASPVLVVSDAVPSHPAIWANAAALRLLDLTADALLGAPLPEVVRSDARAAATEQGDPLLDLFARGGGPQELVLRTGDDSVSHVRAHASRLEDRAGPCWVLELQEISAERRADEELRASEERFRALAHNAPIGIFASESGLRFAFLNERAAELLGRPLDDLRSTGWMAAIDEHHLEAVVSGLAEVLDGGEIDLPIRVAVPQERWVRIRATPTSLPGQGTGFIGTLEDITATKAHEAALAHQATHDGLTGLPNRAYLEAEIAAVLNGTRGGDGSLALVFLDLDNFKLINDSLGHAAGDQLLIAVAERLHATLRSQDILARFGGDEFVLLCPGLASEDQALTVAERMLAALSAPIRLRGREMTVTASLGLAIAESGGTDPVALLRDADAAMYEAKASGRARTAVFDRAAREALEHRVELRAALEEAIAAGDIAAAYQPILDVRSGSVIGVEALVRWEHGEQGPISPPLVVALAEETGAIRDLGALVLRIACSQLATWRSHEPTPVESVSVNISAHQLNDPELVALVARTLSDCGLTAGDLCLEITETVLRTGRASRSHVLTQLRSLGVRIAIDDFGSGSTSFASLKSVPADMLKISRSLIAGMGEDRRDAALVESILRVGGALGLGVVAEGVETLAQRRMLEDLGCSLLQGYLIGGPAEADRALVVPGDAAPGTPGS